MTQIEPATDYRTKAKAIVFTDWDGTVTLQDSNDWLTDNLGFGYDKRKVINDAILDEKTSFRDGFSEMLASIDTPFPECIEHLIKNVRLDPGFKVFYEYCKSEDIPVVIVSSGMKPIIFALLKTLVGEEASKEIEIISNDVEIHEDGSWDIIYRDDSPFGHNKSLAIKPYNQLPKEQRPVLFYCGDGVSDLSAARETDLLFAKQGKDLIIYCEREKIPYTKFESFQDILAGVQAVIKKEKKLEDLFHNENL